jgi:hypothetical protein
LEGGRGQAGKLLAKQRQEQSSQQLTATATDLAGDALTLQVCVAAAYVALTDQLFYIVSSPAAAAAAAAAVARSVCWSQALALR